MHHNNPQTPRSTCSATTSITPCPIWPPFNVTKASCAMLKPDPALSMAVMINDLPVAVLVSLQHPPQLSELNTMPGAPPIKGKVGILPNVGNRAARPFSPFEHATPLREPSLLSYVVSNVARTVVDCVLGFGLLLLLLLLELYAVALDGEGDRVEVNGYVEPVNDEGGIEALS